MNTIVRNLREIPSVAEAESVGSRNSADRLIDPRHNLRVLCDSGDLCLVISELAEGLGHEHREVRTTWWLHRRFVLAGLALGLWREDSHARTLTYAGSRDQTLDPLREWS